MKNNPNEDALRRNFALPENLEPLKHDESKNLIEQYKTITHHYLLAINEVDDSAFKLICNLLLDPSSYNHEPKEKEQLIKSAKNLV